MRALPLLLIAGCHAASPHPPDLATRAAPALKALDPAQLEKDTRHLASDELEGRAPGTPGGVKTEEYIAARFKEIGLEPAGENGTYFQTVPLRSAELTRASLIVRGAAGDLALEPGRDVLIPAWTRAPKVAIDAPLVFAGYGVDLAGVDLHGKIAVIFGGSPRTLGGKPVDSAEHAVRSDVWDRTVALRDHGAVAVLFVYDPVRAQMMPWAQYVAAVPTVMMTTTDGGAVTTPPDLPIVAMDQATLDTIIGAPKAHALWEQLDRGEHPSLELHATASLQIESTLHDITARNVIGRLRGGDLGAQNVVYSAHHDHLGIGKPINGDAIYNGAIDNAIGVSEVLEMAHAMRALPQPPRRSVLFVAVTAEESGLLGSEYFAAHPTVPLDSIVGDINIDGGTPNQDVFDVIAMGSEHSSFGSMSSIAAHAAGLLISPDPVPELVLFTRSDQYSFVKKGIPSVFVGEGNRDAQGHTEANEAAAMKWMAEHYHQPSDEWRDDYRADRTLPELRFELLLGLAVADSDARPQWNAGDVFANAH